MTACWPNTALTKNQLWRFYVFDESRAIKRRKTEDNVPRTGIFEEPCWLKLDQKEDRESLTNIST